MTWAVLLLGIWLSPPSPEAVKRAVQAVYENRDIQRDLPQAEERPPPPARPATYDVPSEGLSTVAKILLWGTAGAALAYLLIAGWNRWGPSSARLAAPIVEAGAAPIALDAPAVAADALAAEGRYAEAVHRLLLMTLEALVAARGAGLPLDYTSREILARVEMPPDARAPLSDLVGAAERAVFAGRPVAAADYAACRAAFERFAATCRAAPA